MWGGPGLGAGREGLWGLSKVTNVVQGMDGVMLGL